MPFKLANIAPAAGPRRGMSNPRQGKPLLSNCAKRFSADGNGQRIFWASAAM